MRVSVYKAIPFRGEETPNLELVATESLPDRGTPEHLQRLDADAEAIVAALRASLPQGTLGRVFAKLAAMYATDLAVAYSKF